MKRRETRPGAEDDVFPKHWRRLYCYTQRAGVTASIKRRARRRERREARAAIRRGDEA